MRQYPGFRLIDGTIDNSQCPHLHLLFDDWTCRVCGKSFMTKRSNDTPYERHIGLEHRHVTRFSPNGFDVIDECEDCQLCFLFQPFQEKPITIYQFPALRNL